MVFNISVISVTSVISVISVISWWSVLLENPGKTTGLTKSLTNFMHAQKRTNNVKVNLIWLRKNLSDNYKLYMWIKSCKYNK